jgi:hypothetical protein
VSTTTQHPRHRLDELLQNAVRFSIVAALDRARTLSFKDHLATLREIAGTSS